MFPRQKMLDDLIFNVLPGKTKKEALYILGEPDLNENNNLIYLTGLERKEYVIPIDNEYFVVVFDNKGVFDGFYLYSN